MESFFCQLCNTIVEDFKYAQADSGRIVPYASLEATLGPYCKPCAKYLADLDDPRRTDFIENSEDD